MVLYYRFQVIDACDHRLIFTSYVLHVFTIICSGVTFRFLESSVFFSFQISDIRERQYEKMGIGSSYLFRLDDGYVVSAMTVLL